MPYVLAKAEKLAGTGIRGKKPAFIFNSGELYTACNEGRLASQDYDKAFKHWVRQKVFSELTENGVQVNSYELVLLESSSGGLIPRCNSGL
jgi:hypothetical protein